MMGEGCCERDRATSSVPPASPGSITWGPQPSMRPDTLGKPLQVLVHSACSKVSAASDVPDEALRDRAGRSPWAATPTYATPPWPRTRRWGRGHLRPSVKCPKGLPNLLPSQCRSMWQLLSRAVYCAVPCWRGHKGNTSSVQGCPMSCRSRCVSKLEGPFLCTRRP